MQFIKGITQVYDGLTEVASGLNPLISTTEDPTNQEILDLLISKNFTQDQILNFIDISKVQAEEYITFEMEIQKRLKTRTRTRKSA